jgi:sugar/nucleoside kinase (ribokinase family)
VSPTTNTDCPFKFLNAFKVADSQVASRWGNITEFKNFDLITPNEREARFALGDQDSTVGKLSKILVDETNCTTLMLKLGDRGVYGFEAGDVPENDLGFSIDSFADRVLDAVGAGDAFLAYSSLALRATCSPIIAGILGSIAAACECEIDGNKPIFPEAIASKIDNVEKLVNYQFR